MEGRTLEDAMDGSGGPGHDDFGVPRESPTLGDGTYKLEIGMRQAGYFPSGDLREGRCAHTDRHIGHKYPYESYTFPLCDVPYVG